MIKVLLIEDNPGDARLIEEMLKEADLSGYYIKAFTQLSHGIKAVLSAPYNIILLDLNLPDSQGLETLTRIYESVSDTAIIILTGTDDQDTAVDALRKGAQDYLVKDQLNADLLARSIRYSIERKQIEQVLVKREQELEIKTEDLEDANTALRVLIKKGEEDKKELEERLVLNVKELLEPMIDKLKESGMNKQQMEYIDVIESHIDNIIAPLIQGLSVDQLKLTPTELRIANLIRYGKTTKEIAQMLNLSMRTIDVNRNNIRKKIGISNQKINLQTYLNSFR